MARGRRGIPRGRGRAVAWSAAALAMAVLVVSDYYGRDGIEPRDDLAGLNLSTVPKVLIECGNMRNPVDARLLTSAAFQRQLAAALAAAITRFLETVLPWSRPKAVS